MQLIKVESGLLIILALCTIAGCSGSPSSVLPNENGGTPLTALESMQAGAKQPVLAVAGQNSGSIVIFDAKYQPIETITGFAKGNIYDDRYDRNGNLYVTDQFDSIVDEYTKGSTIPTFQYTTLVEYPIGVNTDSQDNVYVTNYLSGVSEFNQKVNVPIHSCAVPGYSVGVAVGKAGEVFVTFNSLSSGNGGIVEFPHGLSDCKRKTLNISLKGPYTGKLQLDEKQNLVVADQESRTIDVIAPPYSSITKTIRTCRGPFGIALDKTNTQMYVACGPEVSIVSYPDGTPIHTLKGKDIAYPVGVSTYP
jgi:hypothetical protein